MATVVKDALDITEVFCPDCTSIVPVVILVAEAGGQTPPLNPPSYTPNCKPREVADKLVLAKSGQVILLNVTIVAPASAAVGVNLYHTVFSILPASKKSGVGSEQLAVAFILVPDTVGHSTPTGIALLQSSLDTKSVPVSPVLVQVASKPEDTTPFPLEKKAKVKQPDWLVDTMGPGKVVPEKGLPATSG